MNERADFVEIFKNGLVVKKDSESVTSDIVDAVRTGKPMAIVVSENFDLYVGAPGRSWHMIEASHNVNLLLTGWFKPARGVQNRSFGRGTVELAQIGKQPDDFSKFTPYRRNLEVVLAEKLEEYCKMIEQK